jgi:hypothetical protein
MSAMNTTATPNRSIGKDKKASMACIPLASEPEIRLIAIELCEVPTWRPLTPPIDQKGSPYSRSMNDQPPWSSRPSSNRHFSRATSTFGSGRVTTSAGRGDSMALLVFSAMTKILDFGVGSSHVGYFGGFLMVRGRSKRRMF